MRACSVIVFIAAAAAVGLLALRAQLEISHRRGRNCGGKHLHRSRSSLAQPVPYLRLLGQGRAVIQLA